MGLALIPIPFHKFASLRIFGGFAATGCSIGGYCISNQKKEEQRAIDLWEWEQQQKQKALEATIRPVLETELIEQQQVRLKYSIADIEEEMKGHFTALQVERYGEEWLRSQVQPPETEYESTPKQITSETEPDTKQKAETLAAKKAKLLKLIEEHEGGWIGQLLQKPLLVFGDMGSFKSYFVEFLALCRIYLRGHQVISIADPHFHQNKDASWSCLVKLGVPGYGTHHDYRAVGEQLNAMYARFASRTLKDKPYTSIWDEVTGYGFEEGTKEPAKKLIQKVVADPRKANECPILIGHDNTLVALGGSEGFSKSRDRGIIQLELYSDSENKPLFKGTLSGIKNSDGEFIDAQKVSIAADWIRPEWIYNLFNSNGENQPEFNHIKEEKKEITKLGNQGEFLELTRKWLDDVYEVEVTSNTTPWDEVPEVVSEIPEVRKSNTSGFTSLLPEDVRSEALTRIIALLQKAGSTSSEVISLIPTDPDRAVWVGIKSLNKSMTAVSRDIFNTGTGGAKFKSAKTWYESLKKEFD